MEETVHNLKPNATAGVPAGSSPFALDNAAGYQRWRERKLDAYPQRPEQLIVEARDPRALSPDEARRMLHVLRKTNMVIYRSALGSTADKAIPRALGAQFGLHQLDPNPLADDDGISSLQVVAGKSGRGYIPYSNKRLLWHTDGYYNAPQQQIRAIVLHCVAPAADGGANGLLDPEIAYLLLRDADPDYVRALMAPDAMTIPANEEAEAPPRPAVSGPVFSIDAASGNLHMRYTARMRSIEWKRDSITGKAVEFLQDILSADCPYAFHYRLAAGEGLLCNNVLHNRSGFAQATGQGRLIYRARYYERIAGTDVRQPGEEDR